MKMYAFLDEFTQVDNVSLLQFWSNGSLLAMTLAGFISNNYIQKQCKTCGSTKSGLSSLDRK